MTEQLVRLGRLAERYFPDDPEYLPARAAAAGRGAGALAASRIGLYAGPEEKQTDLLRRRG